MAGDRSKLDMGDDAGRAAWVEEEREHIRNATTDLTQFMRSLDVGTTVADTEVYAPDGQVRGLADCWARGPGLIVCGSLTCPPSRVFNPAIQRINSAFGRRLQTTVLYVIDAHPFGSPCPYTGTDWVTADNEAAGLLVAQPQVLEDRLILARRYIELLGLQSSVFVDGMQNAAWEQLGRSPNSATVIGADGAVLFWQDWFRPDALLDWLTAHLPD